MKLIKAKTAKEFANTLFNDPILKMAANAVIDRVPGFEFVTCKECKNWMYEYDDIGLCVTDVPDIDGVQRLAFDYCSYGERKDGKI